jgi:fucose permease
MPASSRENRVVYGAGVVQGIVLVTFPAASTIFTDPDQYDLSNTQYGLLFVPQVVTAIAASLAGAGLARRFGTKRIYLGGLAAGLVAMGLLIVSQFFETNTAVAFPLLLVATGFLGVGFGLTVPALNTLTAAFHPDGVESSVLVLNALLGLGTTLAPVFVAIFVGLGFWWGLPVTSAVLLTALIVTSLDLPLRAGAASAPRQAGQRRGFPSRFWVFAAFAVLYGICETVNGNWSQLDMTTELGASTTEAALALTAFWAMVTVGRVVFAAVDRWVPERVTYNVLPFGLAGTFALIALLPDDTPALGVLALGLAGLGCSALLPLTIGFAQEELTTIAAAAAGGHHRVLPARLRHRRLRGGAAPRRRRHTPRRLRSGCRNRGRHGAALLPRAAACAPGIATLRSRLVHAEPRKVAVGTFVGGTGSGAGKRCRSGLVRARQRWPGREPRTSTGALSSG